MPTITVSIQSISSCPKRSLDSALGLNNQGPLPVEVARVSRTALVAEVVMVPELTPLLQAVQTRGLEIVCGREMLTQQVEAFADFFGWTV